MKKALLILLSAVMLTGCTAGSDDVAPAFEESAPQKTGSMETEYATGFSVDYYDDGSALVKIGEDSLWVREPFDHIYLASSSAMDLFLQADALDEVVMTSTDKEDWTIPEVAAAVGDGSIEYVGKYSAPDYEAVLDGGCDLVIENTMIYHSPKTKEQLEALGIPVMVETSSYEEHVLGRMEWIRLYGVLTGHEAEAESFWADAKKRLRAVGESEAADKRVAFFYVTPSGYINTRRPGDYISELIEMAGGEYVCPELSRDEESNLSTVNIDVESFVEEARDADILIYNSTVAGAPESLEELIKSAPFLASFRAVESKSVWSTGANMFQMTGELPRVAEELMTVIAGEDDHGLSFFKKLR